MARTVLNPIMVEGYSTPYAVEVINSALTMGENEISVAQDHLSGLLIVFEGAASKRTVTIKAGNGIQGVADLTFDVEPNQFVAICPETGRFKNVYGNDKGKIIITASEEGVKVRAYLLPLK